MMMNKIGNFLGDLNGNTFKYILLFVSLGIVAYLAILNPLGVSPDYAGYVYLSEWMRVTKNTVPFAYEPGFKILVLLLVTVIAVDALVFSSIVFISSAFKLFFLFRLASPIAFFLAIVLFFFKYFPLQNYNQVRIAIALGFLMLAYYYIVLSKNLWLAIIFSFVSVLFHYSTLAVFPVLFLLHFKSSINKNYVLGFSGLVFLGLTVASYFVVHYLMGVIPRLGSYAGIFYPAVSSPLSPVFYPEFFLIAVSLVLWADLTDNMKKVVALQLVGFAIFYGLYEFGVIGTRLREAIAIFWLFYVAEFSKMTINLKRATVVFVLMNIALGSYLFYFSDYFK